MLRVHASLLALSLLAAATMGCGSGKSSHSSSGGAGGAAGADGGGTGGSAAGGGTGGTSTDGGAGTGGSSGAGGTSGTGGTGGTDGGAACAGKECTAFPKNWVRDCTNDQSCVSELHQLDCCGAVRALGVNHSEATKFCTAEYGASGTGGCRASYSSSPGCTANDITVDTGDTTTDPNNIGVRCDSIDPKTKIGTCTTFVCPGKSCPVDNGTCGP